MFFFLANNRKNLYFCKLKRFEETFSENISQKAKAKEENCKFMLTQFLINGIVTGILYSLLAVGFALVYNTTRLFHIVAAAIYVFAAYMFYLFAVTFGMPVLVAAVVAIALTMGLSLLTDIAVYRPLKNRKASNNVAMIIGGVGRFGTCVLGGITLGILQALTVFQFSSNWQNAVTFVLLLILLFLRPQGIAGYKQRTV